MPTKIRGAKRRFDKARRVLEFHPELKFEEPDQIDPGQQVVLPLSPSLDDRTKRTQDLIDGYSRVEVLADLAQARIDERARGFEMNLDPVVDKHVVDAMKHAFPDQDPTKISFENYRACIEHLSKEASSHVLEVTPEDLESAKANPFRTDFAGLGLRAGLNRPDLQPEGQVVQPLDLDGFQQDQLKQLLELLKPGITDMITEKIGGG